MYTNNYIYLCVYIYICILYIYTYIPKDNTQESDSLTFEIRV